MHYGLIHITIATNVTGWSEQMKRKYVSNLGDQIYHLLFTFANIKILMFESFPNSAVYFLYWRSPACSCD